MDRVAYTLQQFILNNQDTVIFRSQVSLNQVLQEILGVKLATVYDYDRWDIGAFSVPCISFSDGSQSHEWFATNFMLTKRFELTIRGFIIHEDDGNNGRAIRRFARAIIELFEDYQFKTIPLLVPPGDQPILYGPDPSMESDLYYPGDSAPPIKGARYFVDQYGDGPIMRAFELDWIGYRNESVGPSPI